MTAALPTQNQLFQLPIPIYMNRQNQILKNLLGNVAIPKEFPSAADPVIFVAKQENKPHVSRAVATRTTRLPAPARSPHRAVVNNGELDFEVMSSPLLGQEAKNDYPGFRQHCGADLSVDYCG